MPVLKEKVRGREEKRATSARAQGKGERTGSIEINWCLERKSTAKFNIALKKQAEVCIFSSGIRKLRKKNRSVYDEKDINHRIAFIPQLSFQP